VRAAAPSDGCESIVEAMGLKTLKRRQEDEQLLVHSAGDEQRARSVGEGQLPSDGGHGE